MNPTTDPVNPETCKCGAPAADLHACPFLSEIYDDDDTPCNCCERCTDECTREV